MLSFGTLGGLSEAACEAELLDGALADEDVVRLMNFVVVVAVIDHCANYLGCFDS